MQIMEKDICPCCGASLKMYWHRLTPILVKALRKFHDGVIVKQDNCIHLIKDLKGTSQELGPYEWKNWTKLRFHGLVAKYKKNGVWKRGYWVLTKRGNDFLHGRIELPVSVLTFRNKIKEHAIDKVSIREVMNNDMYVEELNDIHFKLYEPDVEYNQEIQGEIF